MLIDHLLVVLGGYLLHVENKKLYLVLIHMAIRIDVELSMEAVFQKEQQRQKYSLGQMS